MRFGHFIVGLIVTVVAGLVINFLAQRIYPTKTSDSWGRHSLYHVVAYGCLVSVGALVLLAVGLKQH
jgi:hypothetical protein